MVENIVINYRNLDIVSRSIYTFIINILKNGMYYQRRKDECC